MRPRRRNPLPPTGIGDPTRHLARFAHLAMRFLTSLRPGPPGVEDEVWAEGWLSDDERRLWCRLSNADRRHSIGVARRFATGRRTRAEMAGALLHDIGKIEAGLGTFGRVSATVLGPITPRYQRYRDHEEIGATLLERVGSDPTTVAIVAGRHRVSGELAAADDAIGVR